MVSWLDQAVVAVKIRNLLLSFCSFNLSCPILEKDNLYIVFSYKLAFFLLFVFIL